LACLPANESRRVASSWLLSLSAAGASGAITALALGGFLLEHAAVPLFLLTAASLAVVFWNLSRGSRDLFSMDNVVALAMLPLMGLGAFAMLWLAPRREVHEEDVALALCYALAGLGAFIAGYHSRLAPGLAARLPLLPERVDEGRSRIAIVALLTLAAAGWLVFVWSFGGAAALISGLDWATRHSGGRYALVCAILQAKVAFLIWYAGRLRAGRENPALVLGGLILTVGFVSFIGAKFLATDLVISALALRHYLGRPVRLWHAATAAVALAGLIFVLLAVRIAGGEIGRLGGRRLSLLAGIYLHRECYGPRMLTESVRRIPANYDFLYGQGIAAAIPIFVPRWLYPDKPEGTGARLTRAFFPLRYGTGIQEAPSAITEFYANFGLPGVLAGMWLLGVLLGAIYLHHRRCASQTSAILYSINVVGLLSYLRGDAAGGGAAWVIYAVPALLVLILIGRSQAR